MIQFNMKYRPAGQIYTTRTVSYTHLATLYEWKKKFPEISESLKRGKEVVDRQVENALLKRALGYEYEEVKEKFECGVMTERTVTKKEVVPDTTAQIFWLKNRKPEKWRDKPQEVVDGNESGVCLLYTSRCV